MINVVRERFCNVLQEGLVNSGDCIDIKERDKSKLKKVCVSATSEIISISDKVISRTGVYKKSSALGKNCDGILFYKKGEEQYLFLIELKSSFCDIVKAKGQIEGTSVKVKSFIDKFDGLNSTDFKIIGIILTPSLTEYDKLNFLRSFDKEEQIPMEVYLLRNEKYTIKANESILKKLGLKDSYKNDSLYLFYKPIEGIGSLEGELNLDEYIDKYNLIIS